MAQALGFLAFRESVVRKTRVRVYPASALFALSREPPLIRIFLTFRLRQKQKTPFRVLLVAQAEGFEPPWAFTQTVFKTASL